MPITTNQKLYDSSRQILEAAITRTKIDHGVTTSPDLEYVLKVLEDAHKPKPKPREPVTFDTHSTMAVLSLLLIGASLAQFYQSL